MIKRIAIGAMIGGLFISFLIGFIHFLDWLQELSYLNHYTISISFGMVLGGFLGYRHYKDCR